MARKNLLSEGEVRQFMKLANLSPLSENYFTNSPLEEEEHDFEMDAEMGAMDDMGDEEVEVVGVEDEVGLEGGEEMSAELEDKLAQGVEALAAAWGIEDRVDVEGGEEGGDELEDAEMELGMPGEEDELGGMDLGDDDDLGGRDPYQEGQEIDEVVQGVTSTKHPPRRAGVKTSSGPGVNPASACRDTEHWNAQLKQCDPGPAPAAAGQATATGTSGLEEDAIVAEVARRVAKRLKAENRKEVMADQLAERIFTRLTQK
jgi:hypothetical protein